MQSLANDRISMLMVVVYVRVKVREYARRYSGVHSLSLIEGNKLDGPNIFVVRLCVGHWLWDYVHMWGLLARVVVSHVHGIIVHGPNPVGWIVEKRTDLMRNGSTPHHEVLQRTTASEANKREETIS